MVCARMRARACNVVCDLIALEDLLNGGLVKAVRLAERGIAAKDEVGVHHEGKEVVVAVLVH